MGDFTFRRTTRTYIKYADDGTIIPIDGTTKPIMGQGPAVIANEEDLARDELGFTNPNFHRRVEPHEPLAADNILNQEVEDRSYKLNLMDVYSYRTTEIHVHDENSVTSEIP